MRSQLDAGSRSTSPLTNVPRIFQMMFQHVLTAPHPHPHPSYSFPVCFYRQEVTSSQLFFSIPPSGCSSYLQPIRLLADLLWLSLLFSSYLSAHMLRKIAFVLGLCWRSGEVEVSLRWGSGRHKAEGRRSKTTAGWTIAWILQALHQRDGSYSKIHKEQMVTEKRRE